MRTSGRVSRLARVQSSRRFLLGLAATAAAACRAAPEVRDPAEGRVIVACGRTFYAGVPVVSWMEPDDPGKARHQPGRKERGEGGRVFVEAESGDVERLREVVDQLVLHYDAAGSSRRCLEILKERGLSVHFLVDVDGTIYQALDLRDQAWHATIANARSIGVEIANLGAYPPGSPEIAKAGAKLRGEAQGRELEQPAFTRAQYESLAKLAAALCAIFPRIELDAPRGADGRVRTSVIAEEEWSSYRGILGHLHVQANKSDPGPAFDWERLLLAARTILAEGAP